jgi:hypothetical protein
VQSLLGADERTAGEHLAAGKQFAIVAGELLGQIPANLGEASGNFPRLVTGTQVIARTVPNDHNFPDRLICHIWLSFAG